MITVIIAGGSGTRLWPLSTPTHPKHLLRINGQDRSLLQSTYDRVKPISSAVYIVPEISHAHHVKEQLPDLKEEAFIIEPARRGTASCIVAALHRIAKKHDEREPIAFVAADHYVRDLAGFAHSFRVAAATSKQQDKIVLVGVEPSYPSTGFGYIQKGDVLQEESFVYHVKAFKEKPDYKTAQKYIKSGDYLWNCSYFVAPLKTFLKNIKTYADPLHYEYQMLENTKTTAEAEEAYLKFENISIDYALIEKVKGLLVVPAAFDWMDLGSFGDLHRAVERDEKGNHIHGETAELDGVENSFIQNYEDKPIIVIGLDNVVVVNTKDGLLVARKDLSQKVGDASKKLNRK